MAVKNYLNLNDINIAYKMLSYTLEEPDRNVNGQILCGENVVFFRIFISKRLKVVCGHFVFTPQFKRLCDMMHHPFGKYVVLNMPSS